MSSFSIATGDFKMLSATREAVTTTSFPNTVCVERATCKFEPRVLTSSSCALNPTEVKTSVNGSLVFVLKTKFPVEFVTVPATVPLICTLTSDNGRFFSWSVTCPEISIRVPVCENSRLNDKSCKKMKKSNLVLPLFQSNDNGLVDLLINLISFFN